MKSAKRSYPTWDDVASAVGDKVIAAVGVSVANAATEFALYRKIFPSWVAQTTERGLAGWIHDRMWHHLLTALDGHPDLTVVDKEPLREIVVGPVTSICRFRIKRHHQDGSVSTYRTPLALEFLAQGPEMLGIFAETHLIAGYKWDKELRSIGVPLISLRDGRRHIWEHELELPEPTVQPQPEGLPVHTTPTAPVIDVPSKDAQRADGDSE